MKFWQLRRVLRTALIVGVCFVFSTLCFFLDAYFLGGGEDFDQLSEEAQAWFAAAVLLDFCFGVFSLVVLASVLHRKSVATTVMGMIVVGSMAISGAAGPAALIIVTVVVLRRQRAASITGLALFFVAGTANSVWLEGDLTEIWSTAAVALLMVAGVLLIGMRHRSVEARKEMAKTQLRLDERTAIARDMHDTLSHRLSLISMHAGVLSFRTDLSAEQIREEADLIVNTSQQATQELREVLSSLRSSESALESGNAGPDDLFHQAQDQGQDAQLRWVPPASPHSFYQLSVPVATTMYRAVQEGLVNARKHAPDAPVRCEISKSRNQIVMTMRNPAEVLPTVEGTGSTNGCGFGLIGLAERARTVGGECTVDPPDSDCAEFRISMKLPLKG